MTEMSDSVKKMAEATGSIKQSEMQHRKAVRLVLTVLIFTLIVAAAVEFIRSGVPLRVTNFLEGILVAQNIIYPTFAILLSSYFILNALIGPVYYLGEKARKRIIGFTDFLVGITLLIFCFKTPFIWGSGTALYEFLSTLSSVEVAVSLMNGILMTLFILRYVVKLICFFDDKKGDC